VKELSKATVQAVERTLSCSRGMVVIDLVVDILSCRRQIRVNLNNKKFRRNPIQRQIKNAAAKVLDLIVVDFDTSEMSCAASIRGWDAFSSTHGGTAQAVLAMFCHSVDALAGGIARSDIEITHDLAEKLVLSILNLEFGMTEYTFNQVYELMPSPNSPRMYLYRSLEEVSLFSTMNCGFVEFGGKL
jgi:hypothetical protein